MKAKFTLQDLWDKAGFQPNPNQKQAICKIDGPLFLTAGPGSGKTRVLLWRTLNLIVFHDVNPEDIFLSTFTEKAAQQLKEGLRSLLGLATHHTGQPYDIAKMYVGTVHSLCQNLIIDRRFSPNQRRASAPILLDDIGQYFYLSQSKNWEKLTEQAGLDNSIINQFFTGKPSYSKHTAVASCISLFNRLSEENVLNTVDLQPKAQESTLKLLLKMYDHYKQSLSRQNGTGKVDFSLLQQVALRTVNNFEDSGRIFKHIIIDEYQDTNTIQEQIFFQLAAGYKNICVVGDDDQALYRFRGATVENFVEFPQRCQHYLKANPQKIPLDINYRSRCQIVDFYTQFISHSHCNWKKEFLGEASYRIPKEIQPNSLDQQTSVIASTPDKPDNVCQEIAQFVKSLLEHQKVQDPNQIAFLFPSLKSRQVQRMKEALESQGLQVYAPRAGHFLDVEESVALFGIYLTIFGKPEQGNFAGADYNNFHQWMENCLEVAFTLFQADSSLDLYVRERQADINRVSEDSHILETIAQENDWKFEQPYDLERMKPKLMAAPGLSQRAKRSLSNRYFEQQVRRRQHTGKPYALGDAINRATQLTWNILDLFWQLTEYQHFKTMFDLAESNQDEGPICNLSLITQYLARYMDSYGSFLTGGFLRSQGFIRTFFSSYLYAIFRRGESEYEDADDPFPKGRIPFLTIHQAKGLEFPVVVLGNPRKDNKGPQFIEKIVRPLLDKEGEPLERQAEFDIMRMFYVALSRAENLLVIAHFKGSGNRINQPFKSLLTQQFPRIPDFNVETLPEAKIEENDIAKSYTYTSDYLLYQECPRQYMIFRKYGFAASQTETQLFGNLIHQTIEDLHHYLISNQTKI